MMTEGDLEMVAVTVWGGKGGDSLDLRQRLSSMRVTTASSRWESRQEMAPHEDKQGDGGVDKDEGAGSIDGIYEDEGTGGIDGIVVNVMIQSCDLNRLTRQVQRRINRGVSNRSQAIRVKRYI